MIRANIRGPITDQARIEALRGALVQIALKAPAGEIWEIAHQALYDDGKLAAQQDQDQQAHEARQQRAHDAPLTPAEEVEAAQHGMLPW